MLSQYDTPDANTTADLFDMTSDFTDPLDNSQVQLQQSTSTNPQPSSAPNPYARVNYMPQPRSQLLPYQTPNLQRIQTMPTSTNIRQPNIISSGIQQQSSMYTPQQQQQMMGAARPVYPRMTTLPQQQQQQQQQQQLQQTMSAPLIRQAYAPSGMVQMAQNVTQMNIVKASDPNNNSLFVTNPQQQQQQQQQSTLVGLQPPQHTVTQTNKPMATALPSLNPQQLNQYQVQMQQQNSMQSYNIRVCRIFEAILIFLLSMRLFFSHK